MSIAARNISLLLLVIALAAIFYFWGIDRHDVVTDEASYLARGIRMVDFDFGIEQPTPLRWVSEVPWWMKFSFHDHPPLVFFLEYLSMSIFGENVTAGRIVPVVSGLFSVLFLYLIAKELYSPKVGMVSAVLFAATVNHVWISRIALQESVMTALMLAASFVFLRALDNKKLLALAGAMLGLAILAKYTAAILLPVFLTILFFKRRGYFLSKEFLFAVILVFVFISPMVIYNVGLYKKFGHFDFQISYITGQKVAAWKEAPGKEEIGSMMDRIQSYLPTIYKTNSPLFLILSAAGLIIFRLGISSHFIIWTFFLWQALLMLVVGPTHRFLTMLTPWFSIFAALFIVWAWNNIFKEKRSAAAKGILSAIIIFEAAFAYNSVIAITPWGKAPWTYSPLRSENSNWGYNQLEDFMREELGGRRPEPAISFDYPVYAKTLERTIEKETASGLKPESIMIIYNGNISVAAQLWTFLRRAHYHGWPTGDADTYRRVIAENGPDHFKTLGIKKMYFINHAENVLLRTPVNRTLTPDGKILEREIAEKGIKPREIKNLRGETAFRVYEVAL